MSLIVWADGTYCDTENDCFSEFCFLSDDYVILEDGDYYIDDGVVIERRVIVS